MSSFILLSAVLMLSAMYLQNYYTYGNKFSKFNIKNVFEQREVIEHELTLLDKDMSNKYLLFSFQYSIFALTPFVIYLGTNFTFIIIWIVATLILLSQYIMEFKVFKMNALLKMILNEESAKEVLDNYEVNKVTTKIKNIEKTKLSQDEKKKILTEDYPGCLVSSFEETKNSYKALLFSGDKTILREVIDNELFETVYNDTVYSGSLRSPLSYYTAWTLPFIEVIFFSVIMLLALN